jgi:hypothetical protein
VAEGSSLLVPAPSDGRGASQNGGPFRKHLAERSATRRVDEPLPGARRYSASPWYAKQIIMDLVWPPRPREKHRSSRGADRGRGRGEGQRQNAVGATNACRWTIRKRNVPVYFERSAFIRDSIPSAFFFFPSALLGIWSLEFSGRSPVPHRACSFRRRSSAASRMLSGFGLLASSLSSPAMNGCTSAFGALST